jgi:hypothetical protein
LVLPHLLLKLLGKPLRALAHGVDRAALAVGGAVRITLAERTFRIAHGAVGIREIVAALVGPVALLALLAFLVLSETALLHLLKELFQLLPERLLVLAELATTCAFEIPNSYAIHSSCHFRHPISATTGDLMGELRTALSYSHRTSRVYRCSRANTPAW